MDEIIVSGSVIEGKKRGAGLGFPTINISVTPMANQSWGIYFSEVIIDGVAYQGVTHYGPVPSFGDQKPSCETFLLNVSENLYGKYVIKKLLKKHRDIINFNNAADLKKKISEDIDAARKYFSL